MLVELFGPPAAGKTTLARALAAAFEQNGRNVKLVESSRPAERSPIPSEGTRTLPRLGTAVIAPLKRGAKVVSALPVLLGARHDDLTASLLDLLPPRSLLWSVRTRRYLSLLASSWQAAATSDGVTIVDQGYVTALCSLSLLAGVSDRRRLERGLDVIPYPDLLIHLDAPRQTLEARLRERLARQGPLERLFELDLDTNLKQIETTTVVLHMLEGRGFPMLHVSCLDHHLLEAAVERIVQEAELPRAHGDDGPRPNPYLAAARRQGRRGAGHLRASMGGGDRPLSS